MGQSQSQKEKSTLKLLKNVTHKNQRNLCLNTLFSRGNYHRTTIKHSKNI